VFLLQSLEADALLGRGFLVDQLEDFLDVGDVLPRLLEVALEAGLELLVVDLLDQLREGLVCELPLDVEDVAELVNEEVSWCCELRQSTPFPFLLGRNSNARRGDSISSQRLRSRVVATRSPTRRSGRSAASG
jgi:hypothetical protein